MIGRAQGNRYVENRGLRMKSERRLGQDQVEIWIPGIGSYI